MKAPICLPSPQALSAAIRHEVVPHCLPAEGQLFLRVEALRTDGTIGIVRQLSAWSSATKSHASDKKTIIGLNDCLRADEVLNGVRSITVSLKLQTDRSGTAFYPEDTFITKTFEVTKLLHAQ